MRKSKNIGDSRLPSLFSMLSVWWVIVSLLNIASLILCVLMGYFFMLFCSTFLEYNPDQARHYVGSDLEANCLQKLSTDGKS